MEEFQGEQGGAITSFAKKLHQYVAVSANIDYLNCLLRSYIRRAHIVPESEIEEAAFDLFQDVMLKALQIQDQYPGNDVQAWLLGIAGKLLLQKKEKVFSARETAVSNLSETQRDRVSEADFFDQFATMAMNDPNQNFALRNQLRFCLDTLSADDQRILLLHTEYGMNLHEVADQLAITHVAARKRFERALARLCNAWNEQENGKGGQSHG